MSASDHVAVRMYNVGFGDCFLLTIPAGDGPRHILFDCGTHASGPGPRPLSQVIPELIADVTVDGNARIDVVVGTHRHADHVSGFAQRAWRDVEVGEVWMPWTEDPIDPEARKIRERQSRAARRLMAALAARGQEDTLAFGLAANALTNAKAMETLHRGFGGSPARRFLPEKSGPPQIETPLLPGVRVHVLGPSRSADVIRDMDPPPGAGYLQVAPVDGSDEERSPFPAQWSVPIGQFHHRRALEHLGVGKRDRDYLRDMGTADLFRIAVALEKSVNGTSLVLLLEVGDAFLLFPGDAQWGTWKAILDDPDAKALLEKTTFWKIGHHGSHNATPRRFVEALAGSREQGAKLWSMVSTRHVEQWPEIPKPELIDAVEALRCHLARSDLGEGSSNAGFARYDAQVVEALVPLKDDDGGA